MSLYKLTKNRIFNLLFALTGYVRNEEAFVNLLKSKGYDVTVNRVRGWRKEIPKGNPVPDFAVEILIREMFEKKEQDPNFCLLIEPSEKVLMKFKSKEEIK